MLSITNIHDALDNAPFGPLQKKIFIFAALGIFIDGYDFFIIAAALPLLNAMWHPGPAMLGLIAAAATLGAVVGAAGLGHRADVWGRRALALLTMTLFAVFSIASALAWNVVSLIAIRFLLGAAIGADYPTGASYVAEFMPADRRRRLLFASLSFQAVGAVAGALLGLAFVESHSLGSWRYILGFGAVPAILILLLRRQLPESPLWLVTRGRVQEAAEIMSQLYGRPVTLALAPAAQGVKAAPFSALFGREYIARTFVACVPWFCMDVALYGMALFTPVILAATAFGGTSDNFWTRDIHSLQGAVLLDVLLVIGFVIGIASIRRTGLFTAQTAGFAGMIAGLLIVMLSDRVGHSGLIFFGFAVFNVLVNAGPNGTTYMLAAEIFPTPLRASGSGLAASAGKIGASFGVFMIPVIRAAWGLEATLAFVAFIALIGMLVTVGMRAQLQKTSAPGTDNVVRIRGGRPGA